MSTARRTRTASPEAAALRRRLLAQPGISAVPLCPACGNETPPRDFDPRLGICSRCSAAHAKASDYFAALNAEADSTAPGVFAVRPEHEPTRPEAPDVPCDWPELDEEGL